MSSKYLLLKNPTSPKSKPKMVKVKCRRNVSYLRGETYIGHSIGDVLEFPENDPILKSLLDNRHVEIVKG